jgi:CheY-like chemotaxis protein
VQTSKKKFLFKPVILTMTQILIVDDHSDIRRLLAITLGKEYELLEAEDGVGALEIIRRHHPRIVLLDVMMPGEMDGLQVLETIKANPLNHDILVAMVTARGQAADSDDARRRGADAYFIKPFSPLQVVAWVREKLK